MLLVWPLMTLYMLVMLTHSLAGIMEVLIDRSEAKSGIPGSCSPHNDAPAYARVDLCAGCGADAVPALRAV